MIDHQVCLLGIMVAVYIFGVLASYAVGVNLCISTGLRYEPRGLLLDCVVWPYRFVRLLVLGAAL